MNPTFWRKKRVFITGHTGFKGGWLTLWLHSLGAEIHGYSLHPPTTPNFFTEAEIEKCLTTNNISDVRDRKQLSQAIQTSKPEIVFHLAAQPLVRHSYLEPVETYGVNVMGTVNMLEAVRQTPSVKAVVNVTTDKCYENRETPEAYSENEPMGGFDPYSSSKGCAELVTAAYRKSFLQAQNVALASARAGNVIGGGDWAPDRLIPDFFRAIDSKQTLMIRSPHSTRPWQHVLEPLSGYIKLAEKLFSDGTTFAEAWNFGPETEEARSVRWLLEKLKAIHGEMSWQFEEAPHPHEARYLSLDSGKARSRLQWSPRWKLETALKKTLEWHVDWKSSKNMRLISLEQIKTYVSEESQT